MKEHEKNETNEGRQEEIHKKGWLQESDSVEKSGVFTGVIT